jgi:hypothetical protein
MSLRQSLRRPSVLALVLLIIAAVTPNITLAQDAHEVSMVDGWRDIPRVREALGGLVEGCSLAACHGSIENATEAMGILLTCVFCHGGDPIWGVKELAHVLPTAPVINDMTTLPLDYDLPYQRFVNPSNLRVVDQVCGTCHLWPTSLKKALMGTDAGHYAGGLYLSGVVPSKTPIYGTVDVSDDDGIVPTEQGAVAELQALLSFDPGADPALYSTHFAAVPGQACARCHLYSRGKGFRGALNAQGVYRADGCAACHFLYDRDGLSDSADTMIDHNQTGHPMIHKVTRKIPTQQCLTCHHRGARIGLSFTGRGQMPPRLPSGPGVPGTTDERFNTNFHYTDAQTNPQDLHGERGLDCIDCHTKQGIMGDGNIYGHMDQATKIECRTCHGTPDAAGSLIDNDGIPMFHIQPVGEDVVLTSKVEGQAHVIPQLIKILDPTSATYNANASCAMNDNHIKDQGGLECYSCHAAWLPNCFGCHFERDERQLGQNLLTRLFEVGKVSTNNKVFESFRQFQMGFNSEGRVAPFIVGCQVVADVTAPDGSKILDMVMPTTTNGLSGLALQPVQPHTIRPGGEVRTCVECHRAPPAMGLGSGNYSIARNNAYATSTGGIEVFDRKTDPTDPTPAGTIPISTPLAMTYLPDEIEGTVDYLYVAAGSGGLDIFDLQSGVPSTPVGSISGINAIDVSRTARYLYVVVSGVGVNIYDVQNPTVATYVTTIPITSAVRVVPWGIHLFVAAGSTGLVIVDITDNAAPVILRTVPGMNAVDVTLYAHMQMGSNFAARAYVADPGFGVRVVDLLPDYELATLAGGVAIPGASGLDTYTHYVLADAVTPSREHDYLYVAAGAGGLHVLDITEPDAITTVGSLPALGGMAVDVDVSSDMNPPGVDDYALVTNSVLGVQYIDVTDPTAPALLQTLSAAGTQRAFVEVQQLDRFIDEQGRQLKENSHPGANTFGRADIIRILSADVEECFLGSCCDPAGGCSVMSNYNCGQTTGVFGGDTAVCEDLDTDGIDAACDCDDGSNLIWATPGLTANLKLSINAGTTTLQWNVANPLGGTQTLYDTITSETASDFDLAASCLETNGTNRFSTEFGSPASSVVRFYLIRPENGCGEGSAGVDSGGSVRTVRACD